MQAGRCGGQAACARFRRARPAQAGRRRAACRAVRGGTTPGRACLGRFVALRTKTPRHESSPPSSVIRVLTTSEDDSNSASSRRGTRASSLSKNMTHGDDDVCARANTCRTARSLISTYSHSVHSSLPGCSCARTRDIHGAPCWAVRTPSR